MLRNMADEAGATIHVVDEATFRHPKALVISGDRLSSPFDLTKIIGSSEGYIGYGQGDSLLDQIRSSQPSAIILSEADKAHPSIRGVFELAAS